MLLYISFCNIIIQKIAFLIIPQLCKQLFFLYSHILIMLPTFQQVNGNIDYFINFLSPQKPKLYPHASYLTGETAQSLLLVSLRLYSFVHITIIYIFDFLVLTSSLSKFLYLTNVAYFLAWLYFLTILQSYFFKSINKLHSYCQILFQVAFCLQIIITAAFWLILKPSHFKSSLDFFWSLNAHGIVLFLMMLDFAMNCFRFLRNQFSVFIGVCFSYFVCINMPFSIGVQAIYGKYINWISWETYGIMAGGIVAAGLAHYICNLLFKKIKMPKLAKAEKQEESKAQQKESSKQLVREKIQLK